MICGKPPPTPVRMAKLYPKFRTIALKKVNGAHSSIARSAVIYVKPRQQNRDANQERLA
jgi:hypothetical protein